MQLINKTKPFYFYNNIRATAFKKTADFARQLLAKDNVRKLTAQIFDPNQSDQSKALSAAVGIFVGIIPIWGFQTLAGIFLAVVFKLNKALVIVFSQISFPPFMPLIIYLSYKAGSYWIADKPLRGEPSMSSITVHFQQYVCGSVTLAIAASITAGLATFGWLKLNRLMKQYKLPAPGRDQFKPLKKQPAI